MDAAATYAGSFFMFLDTEFREECLHELQESCEHFFLVMVTVQQDIMDLRVDRGAGMFQIVREQVISGYFESIGNVNQHFKTGCFCTCFNIADVTDGYSDDLTQFFLGDLLFCPIILDAFTYAFIIKDHVFAFLSVDPPQAD